MAMPIFDLAAAPKGLPKAIPFMKIYYKGGGGEGYHPSLSYSKSSRCTLMIDASTTVGRFLFSAPPEVTVEFLHIWAPKSCNFRYLPVSPR